ncbi:DUF222 domain-containing protein [Microbacterium sp. CFBP 13617]|nr:DUF222 domain-containing protein [Microbacterium sp. CFBP 13617]
MDSDDDPGGDDPAPTAHDGSTRAPQDGSTATAHDGSTSSAHDGSTSSAHDASTPTADGGEVASAPILDGEADVDDLLRALEVAAVTQRRATAEGYRLIALLVSRATTDPEPWVGPDPTLDGVGSDPRRRGAAAIARDRRDLAQRAAVAEIAVRLRLSEQTVRVRGSQAEGMRERCPRTWNDFAEGRTSERHAVETARLADSLPDSPETWAAFDDGASERARTLTPAKFVVAARALRERVHADSLKQRHARAARDRGVWVTAELDGMATLSALLPADRAHAAMARVDRFARHLRATTDEERTLAQLRADTLADLLDGADTVDGARPSSAPATAPSPDLAAPQTPTARARPAPSRASIVVTVPALTLLGGDDGPATLDGYGPIDLDTARRLAGGASSWTRVLTHPLSGAPLALDRTSYRVTAALRRWLGVTSPTCVFPGCARSARDCDIDHLTAWAEGGTTDADNLEPECRHHHRLRHESRWSPSRDPDTGDVRWTSPRGHEVDTDPPPF